jgi:4-aminobutyrate aminotransferase
MKAPHIKVTPPGPKAKAVIERDERWVATTTKTSPVAARKASGSVVEDVDGNLYVDFTCGIGVMNVGHAHPRVVEAVRKQVGELAHFAGTDFYYDIQTRLAEALEDIAPGDQPRVTFFANSGTEAVEAAIKVARWATQRKLFLSFIGAFHGRTMGSLALTGSKTVQRDRFFPMMPGVTQVPYAYCYRCPYKLTHPGCDLYCAKIVEDLYFETTVPPDEVAAWFVEPVQGEGGYIVPPPGWLEEIHRIAKAHDILVVVDEVQSGFGRTGKMLASEHSGVNPEIVTMAKAMGSGIPIGAAVYNGDLDFTVQGAHSNTFGGNLVACAAALATIEVIREEGMLENAARLGEAMHARLEEMKERHAVMGDNRGVGLMRATEFVLDPETKAPARDLRNRIVEEAYKRGLILLPAGRSAIRYIPALNIQDDLMDAGLDILEEAITAAGG